MNGKLYIDGVYIGECENTTISHGEIVRSQEIPMIPTEDVIVTAPIYFTYVNFRLLRCSRVAQAIIQRHLAKLN